MGIAKLTLGSYEHAVAWFRRAVEANRNYPIAHFLSAAGLAQLGRMDEAHSAVNAGLALNPAFSTSGARAAWTAMSDNPTYLASIEPVLEAMRKAGVPSNDRDVPPPRHDPRRRRRQRLRDNGDTCIFPRCGAGRSSLWPSSIFKYARVTVFRNEGDRTPSALDSCRAGLRNRG